MRRISLLAFLVLSFSVTKAQLSSALFHNEFGTNVTNVMNGSVTDASVQAASPNNTQLTYLAGSGGATIGVSSGVLNISTTSTSTVWGAVRNSGFSGPPGSLMVKFDANIDVASSGSASKWFFYTGSGFTNGTAAETITAGGNTHSGFAVRYTNGSGYTLSTLGGTLSVQFPDAVSRTFTFVTNNSGSSITYTAPNGTQETLANDACDLWLGNLRVFNEIAAQNTSQTLSQIKFGDNVTSSSGRANWAIDNFIVDPIATTTATTTAASSITSSSFNANWNTVGGAQGYYLDVYSTPNLSDLIISAYIEGSSNNKYVEVYNGTGASVDLSGYTFRLYANGSATVTTETALSGTLAHGAVAVFMNSAAVIYGGSATSNAALNFNGDDAIVLYKTASASNIDIIGRIGNDPGTEWVSGEHSTLDRTLIRKRSVIAGITVSPGGTGPTAFTTLTTEWDVYPIDDVSLLGSHTAVSYVSGFNNFLIANGATVTQNVTGLSLGVTYSYIVRPYFNYTSLNSNITQATTASANSNVTLSEISTIGAASIAQATTNNIIYNFKLDVTTSDATLNQLTIATSGNYTSGDLTNLKLRYHTSNDFANASVIKTIIPAGASTETFGSLSQSISSGATGYFWITADVAGGATVGRTITVTPAIGQSDFTFSAAVNFTTGTINAGGTQTISAGTSGVTLNRISDVSAANIQISSTNNIIYNFRLDVANVAATLTQVVINTSGNYTASDLTNLKLWYKNSNDFSTASAIKTITPAGATSETFGSLSQVIGIGATGYFWITADVEPGATAGRTITVTPALSFSELTFAGATSNTTGTINAGGTQTITSTPSVTLSEISTIGAGNITQAITNNIIYNFKLDVTNAGAMINQVTIATSGNYTSSDLTNLKLWYHTANDFANASAIKTITPAGAVTETFGSLSQGISSGATGYFWITADVAGGATVGRSITVTPAIEESNFTFGSAVNFSTGTINAGGTKTIAAGTSGVTLDEISTIGAGNISQGSDDNIIYNFKLAVTSVAATLTQVVINTSGNYTASDLTNLKLWYKNSNDFSTAAVINTINTVNGAVTETFSGLSQTIGIGATGYFWITADVEGTATTGRTITVTPALSFTELTFAGATSNTTGTINAGGTRTIVATSNATDAFRTKADGNWNEGTPGNVWESFTNGIWMNATVAPGTSAASIAIRATHEITIPNGVTVTADDLTIDANGQIIIASGGTLEIADGSIDLEVNGTLINEGTLSRTGSAALNINNAGLYEHGIDYSGTSITLPAGLVWAAGSTLKLSGTYSGSGDILTSSTIGSGANVLFDCNITDGTNGRIRLASLGTTLGNITVTETGNGPIFSTANDGTTGVTVATYTQTGGKFWINRNGGSGTRTLTVTGNIIINGGTFDLKQGSNSSTGRLNAGGDISVGASGTLTSSGSGTASLFFTSSSAQQLNVAGTFTGPTIGTGITVSGAGGVTLNSDLTLPTTGSLTLTTGNFTVAATKTLTFAGTSTASVAATRILTVDGTLTRTSSGTFTTTGSLSISNGGKYVHAHNSGTIPTATWNTGAICEVTGATTTAPTGLNQSFHHFTWNCSGQSTGLNLLSAMTTVNGNFEIQHSNNQNLRVSNGTLTMNIGGNLNISGLNGAAKLDAANAGNSATINVTGNVIIGSAGTLSTAGASTTINTDGNWNNSGTFTNTSTTIEFSGTNAQSITKSGGESFNNLVISNTANTVTAVNNISAGGTITSSAGSILDMGTNTLTVATVNHAGTIQTQNTGATPITSGKTWGGTVQYNSASAQNVVNGNYTDLTTSGGDRTLANSGVIGVAGTFTPGAGAYTITGSTIEFNKSSSSQTVNAFIYNHLTLSGAATKSFAGNASVAGDFTVSGGAVTAPSIMTFNGGSAQSIAGLGYATVAFNGAGNKTFNSDGSVTTAVTFASGQSATIDFDGTGDDKVFTVRSTVSNTARIANKESYTLSGSIKAERYYPARRAWRLMAAPVSSTGSIFSNWQNGGVYTAGIGALITGTGANPGTNGLDASPQNTTTLYNYNQAGNAWSAISNTLTTNVSDHAAYLIFIRGDRHTDNLASGNTSITTLHSTGAIKSGDQVFSTNAVTDGYTLVGNPFPSPVDFDLFYAANTSSNIKQKFWTLDPTLGDRGSYVSVTYVVNTYVVSNGSSAQDVNIQSGQGFFLESKATGTTQVTFSEGHKSSVNINNVFRPGTQMEKMLVNLKRINANSTVTNADGITAVFHNSLSKAVDETDAEKFDGFDESISFARDGKLLCIEAMPLADVNDTLFLSIANMKQANYEWSIEPVNFNAPGLAAYLEDAFTGTSTQLSLSSVTNISFSVTSNTGTSAVNRFRIVFKSNNPLPVSFLNIKAYEKGAAIEVEWSIASESGVNRYEVEESADAINFTKSKTVFAKANNNSLVSYSWIDNNILPGANYYRVKSIGNNGDIKLSNIVKVNIGKAQPGISIYPNPVTNGSFNLQMSNMEAGDYTLRVLNTVRQKILDRSFKHTGGSATQTIAMDKQLPPGIYQLIIQHGNGKQLVQSIIVND